MCVRDRSIALGVKFEKRSLSIRYNALAKITRMI